MSNWLGKVGNTIRISIKVKGYVKRNKRDDKDKLLILEDRNGNILTIRSVGKFLIGQEWILDGIVKNHATFKGQKQTHITGWGLMFGSKNAKSV